jgi:hypothetical protein
MKKHGTCRGFVLQGRGASCSFKHAGTSRETPTTAKEIRARMTWDVQSPKEKINSAGIVLKTSLSINGSCKKGEKEWYVRTYKK